MSDLSTQTVPAAPSLTYFASKPLVCSTSESHDMAVDPGLPVTAVGETPALERVETTVGEAPFPLIAGPFTMQANVSKMH